MYIRMNIPLPEHVVSPKYETPTKFFRGPVVEAMQFTGDNWREIEGWCGGKFMAFFNLDDRDKASVGMLESGPASKQISVEVGYWVIRYGDVQNFYAIRHDRFVEDYVELREQS